MPHFFALEGIALSLFMLKLRSGLLCILFLFSRETLTLGFSLKAQRQITTMASTLQASHQIEGFLFDIDGTLANTDPTHFKVFQELLLEHPSINDGKPIDEDFFRTMIAGRQNILINADLFPDFTSAESAAWSERKEARFRQVAEATLLESKTKGLDRLRDFIDVGNFKFCAVTNAPRLNAEAILSGIGYSGWFGSALVIGDECER